MTLQINPFADRPFGALVTGWEPADKLTDATVTQLKQALNQHSVLLLRGQAQATDANLVDMVHAFGEPIMGSPWFANAGKYPEILPVTNIKDDDGLVIGADGAGSLEWHCDYSHSPTPAQISFLNAVELPDNPPSTYFASMYHAFDTIPPELQEELRGLSSLHSVTDYMHAPERDVLERVQRNRAQGLEGPEIPEAVHPIILKHPETGRELVYVSRGATKQVLGYDKQKSSALLKQLHVHATDPANVYAHSWQVGDLVIFDALGMLHRRDEWDPEERRYMRQMSTICRFESNQAAGTGA